jgi:hypothetical protein
MPPRFSFTLQKKPEKANRMKFVKVLLTLFVVSNLLTACIETEIVPEVLEPTLVLNPKSISLTVGQNAPIQATFTDENGVERSNELQWRSANPSVASIASGGIVSALAAGQSWIVVTAPGLVKDSTLITVTSNANQVAKVEIAAAQNAIALGGTLQFTVKVQNAAGQDLTGKTITWSSSNSSILSINGSGLASAVATGTAQITATVEGIASLPFNVQVGSTTDATKRTGTFRGNSSYNVSGTAVLQQQGTALKLVLEDNFRSSNGPQLGVFLAKNAPAVLTASNSVSLGALKSNAGKQEYNVAAGVKLTDYDFVVVYCIPFNIPFGYAKLE